MIQRPSQEEIEKGLAEFKGDYKRLLRNITNCLEFDYKAICSLRTILADSKEDIAEIKRTIRQDDIIRINRLAQDCSSKLSYYIDIAKDHIQKIFGCGLYTINNSTNMSTYSNGSNYFSHNSSSKVLLVEMAVIETAS